MTSEAGSIESTEPGLAVALRAWAASIGVDPARLPDPARIERAWPNARRPPAPRARIEDWERRHGYRLPRALVAWLLESDGLYGAGPVIHPIGAIGPMVAFARVPGLVVQPESWFELGNPTETETICVDLAYRWPGGDFPVFASGDDETGAMPRLIATSFESWLIGYLEGPRRPYWLEPGFAGLGDPWGEHRLRAPAPRIEPRLRHLLRGARSLLGAGSDEGGVARGLHIGRIDAEALVRYVQHGAPRDPIEGAGAPGSTAAAETRPIGDRA